MKIQTFSIVVGDERCNAKCPYCVAKMTPDTNVSDVDTINIRNFKKACRFAQINNISTVLLTGKGEPTLFPEQINTYLSIMQPYDFPFIELQTNGIKIEENPDLLKTWSLMGLSTICISCVHFAKEKNREIYGKNYPALPIIINQATEAGLSVRLSCIMVKDYVDHWEEVRVFAETAKALGIEQLTFRPVTVPDYVSGGDQEKAKEVANWVKKNSVKNYDLTIIKHHLNGEGTELLKLMHGAVVYDYEGQNVCLTNRLTRSTNEEEIRQLIFYPNGRIAYDWVYEGATLL